MKDVAAGICFVALVCSSSSAQIVNVSQTREIRARGGFSEWGSETNTATGNWNRSITVRDVGFFSGGTANQNTTIGTDRIFGNGFATAQDDIQTTWGEAHTSFEAFFDVTTPSSFTFSGSWSTSWDWAYAILPLGELVFKRVSPSAETLHRSRLTFDFDAGTATTAGSANLGGTLATGRYRLFSTVGLQVGNNPGLYSGNAQYQFDLRIPAPASLALVLCMPFVNRRR